MITKQNKAVKQNDDIQLGQILAGYLTYWPIFLIFLLLAIGGAFFYLRYAPVKFEAKATLVIKDEKKGEDGTRPTVLSLVATYFSN